ncbi:PQQ-dependent sugar dehydrogenase [Bowmanella dokdonensis]|uniref:PQQ-dependent sugar dehydrogenase n=1 Tax=Bowmanella dokdonensis TaxID=751969 RepID=A0A939ISL2_9ALTE|nr:PQQ-dependent sugar dehydrogenase [Bowmanella dokdonensis]MBN7827309.1 PQQ-dependent sugar dehydrogenase [Bowmanella dokdonensis]
MKNNKWQQVVVALAQLGFVALASILGYWISREVNLIPRFVMRLPEVYVSVADMGRLTSIFVLTFLIQIFLSNLLFKSQAFSSLKRFGNEYLCYLFAYTTASLYSFLATTINYDPQLIAAIGLLSTLFYLLAMAAVLLWRDRASIGAAIGQPIWALLKCLASIPGVLALVYFLLPLALGVAFTADRDIANRITQIRIFFNPVPESEWGLKNLYPGLVFEQPVLVRQAPGETDSLYILERVGRVYKVPFPEGGEKQLVLDISDQLGEVEVENGAVGMAFHPQFSQDPSKRLMYLYYTDTRPEEGQLNKLSRFDLASGEPGERKASEFVLLSLPRSADGFHNGGSVEFGLDGYLYIGLGEGVHPKEGRTSAEVLRAGILRLDVDMQAKNPPPAPFGFGQLAGFHVPDDNPFLDNPEIRNEYWALGLRNPFRFTFDPQTGDLWLGDVGSTIWEEVNKVEKGKHYQFPVVEGRNETGSKGWEQLNLPEQGPVYTYQHSAYDRAVIGGALYRGDKYPSLKDKYVFADNYSAKIFVMDGDQPQVEEVKLIARANQYAQRGVSSVVQLASGELLVTTLGAASDPSGEVLMLVRAEEADVVEPEEEKDSVPKDYNEEATAALFAVNCARCHGVKGDGKGPDSSMLGVELPDLTSPMFHFKRSAEEIHAVIDKGGAAEGLSPMMPPWGGFLKPEEIDHLVIYIQSLPDKHHHH